jgi:hypothetical protein
MSYFSKSSNLFSIRSAIEEFKQVILVQNQVIANLQTALNASVLRVDALETTTASNTSAITANTSAIASNTTAITANTTAITANVLQLEATNRTVLSNTQNLSVTMTNVGNLQPVVASHTASLATLQSQVTAHSSDLATKTTQISVLDSISGGHTMSIGANYNEIFRLNGVTLNHTTLLAGLRTDINAVGSVSDSDITALQSAVSTINTTLTSHDSRIFTNTTDVFQLQTNGHGARLDSIESTLTAMRTDVDANTLSNTQFLTALQYQSDTIFAIDQAIAILNTTIDSNLIRLGILETTQVTHDALIREFDQEFNDPATGVIFKLDTLTTTYNAHISGAFLTIRQNVDSNNLILGTLSTHTTSLLTAMTQLVPRVDNNESDVIILFSAISTLGTTTEANRLNFEDLEQRVEDLEAAP